VRLRGEPPRLVRVSAPDVADAVASAAQDLAAEWNTIGVVVPLALYDGVAHAFTRAGIDFTDGRAASALGEHTTLLPAASVKGLEFDATVVVEPAAIIEEEEAGGVRALYIALTRAVQVLTIVHAEPLPLLLSAAEG
jgi:hypothetical protein